MNDSSPILVHAAISRGSAIFSRPVVSVSQETI